MLMKKIIYQLAQSDSDLQEILNLQLKNHFSNLSDSAKTEQGFLTVRHELAQLQAMRENSPQFLAKCEGRVVGYVLSMHYGMRDTVPALAHLFEELDQFSYKELPLSKHPFIICGQTCIDSDYRGLGIMQQLYHNMREELSKAYTGCVTEISGLNQRSLNAHGKIGFETITKYNDRGQEWNIVLWDWKKQYINE
ncbi:MAG: GNAT family N-acetyltransferase [Pedobacter sp.]|nr:MAG: GNAT family N-acetyltransferase [Pedobacter sp.]